jgi:ferredoxin-type protein NapF
MPQKDGSPSVSPRRSGRVLRLATRLAVLIAAAVLASQALATRATASSPAAGAAGAWWQDAHAREWSAVLPALSPYTALLAAGAQRSLPATAAMCVPVLVAGLFWRQWFCRYACPTGLLMEWAGRASPSRRKLAEFPRLARWVVFVTAAGALLGWPFFLWLDPLSMFHGLASAVRWPVTAASAAAAPLLVAMAIGVVWPGAWCCRLCPLGYAQELLSAPRRLLGRKRGGAAEPSAAGTSGAPAALLSRRGAMFGVTGLVAAGAALGVRWAIGAKAGVLRPPGAAAEDLFQALCSRCGNCVRACPSKIIQPDAGPSGVAGLLTPALRMGPGYCLEDCNECGKVCPTGAIAKLPLAEKNRRAIGVARIDAKRCWPWGGRRECDKCAAICPLEAIDNFTKNPPLPVMLAEKCNGCGKCEAVCPVGGGTAIAVRPP